jgi:hypothetical protein
MIALGSQRGGIDLILIITILFSLLYLFQINKMTYALCESKEIPEEKQQKIFTTVNVLVTILIVSFYVEILLQV